MESYLTVMVKSIVSGFFWLSAMSVNCLGSEGSFAKDDNDKVRCVRHAARNEGGVSKFHHRLNYYAAFIASMHFESFVDLYNFSVSTEGLRFNSHKFLRNPFPIIGTAYVEIYEDEQHVIKQATEDDFF